VWGGRGGGGGGVQVHTSGLRGNLGGPGKSELRENAGDFSLSQHMGERRQSQECGKDALSYVAGIWGKKRETATGLGDLI